MPKPTVTPEQLKQRTIEPDAFPPVPGDQPQAEQVATVATADPIATAFMDDETDADGADTTIGDDRGFDVPPSPILARADRVLAQARDRTPEAVLAGDMDAAMNPRATRQFGNEQRRDAAPVTRNYAQEQFNADLMDDQDKVVDLMQANVSGYQLIEPVDPATFREFKERAEYERFMLDPIIVRIHRTGDENEPPEVFVGVNGNSRWLPRDSNLRIPRFLVEALGKAQEMRFKTTPNPDPTVDNAMKTIRKTVASYSFSVLHDPNQNGPRWLRRIIRQGA